MEGTLAVKEGNVDALRFSFISLGPGASYFLITIVPYCIKNPLNQGGGNLAKILLLIISYAT